MKLRNCNAENFISELEGRKAICFGAGSTLIESDFWESKIEKLEEHIAFFIDNDIKKHGNKFKFHGHEFDIKGVDAFQLIDKSKYVILITCLSYVEIYRQLKNLDILEDMDCYMYDCICTCPGLDVNNFFEKEIEKRNFKQYRDILKKLNLKDKHKGKRCFIIGNGPSLRVEDLERLKGEVTFATNRIFMLFSQTVWRPTYYFCIDYYNYKQDYKQVNEMEAGVKFIPVEIACAAGAVYDNITYYKRVLNYVSVRNGEIIRGGEFPFSENVEEKVYGGRTVVYDALQFALYMGFDEIYLLGVDHNYCLEVMADGTIIKNNVQNYFCDEYEKDFEKDSKTLAAPLYAVELAYKRCREICEEKNVVIKNATRGGKLEIFDRINFDEINWN